MRFHWQDLNDSEPKRYWLYGRAWLGSLGVEWHTPGGSHWSVTFGGGDSGRNLGVCFALPWLLTVYVTFGNFFPRQLFAYDFDRGNDRQIGCYFHEWAFRYTLWVGTKSIAQP